MIFHVYDPDWRHGIPRSEPPYSYEYVKDLRYIAIKKTDLIKKFPTGKGRLKHSFISDKKTIYQIQFHHDLTSVYQISFEQETSEEIDDFLLWLNAQLFVGEIK